MAQKQSSHFGDYSPFETRSANVGFQE